MMNKINTIVVNGVEYEIVDKATRDALEKMNEPYISTTPKADVEAYGVSATVTDGFEVLNYPNFYFTSTNENRKLYTKLGNSIPQNMVCSTEHLSNEIKDLAEGEVITIYYGE